MPKAGLKALLFKLDKHNPRVVRKRGHSSRRTSNFKPGERIGLRAIPFNGTWNVNSNYRFQSIVGPTVVRRLLYYASLALDWILVLNIDDHMSFGETAKFSGCNRKVERGQQMDSLFYCARKLSSQATLTLMINRYDRKCKVNSERS